MSGVQSGGTGLCCMQVNPMAQASRELHVSVIRFDHHRCVPMRYAESMYLTSTLSMELLTFFFRKVPMSFRIGLPAASRGGCGPGKSPVNSQASSCSVYNTMLPCSIHATCGQADQCMLMVCRLS